MINASGYAVYSSTTPLKPYSFERRDPGAKDVVIDIEYCGVCHSDIHQVRDEWGGSIFPMVSGHEIVGTVSAVGKEVTRLKPGDTAGVGVIVDSLPRMCKLQAWSGAVLREGNGGHLRRQGPAR
jgi:alcohol dehydrogenase (NADP+)